MSLPKCDQTTRKYFENLMTEVNRIYLIAESARAQGKDFETNVEIKRAINLAERTEAIIGPPGIAKRFLELMEKMQDRTKVIFKIFEEIVDGKLGNILDEQKRVEQAVKSALVLTTEGTVVAPIDGLPDIKIGKNADNSKYVDLYFAGPIRAAGATAAALPLILAARAQVMLNMGGYIPTESEIERYVEEAKLYEKISPRQFRMTDDDVRYVIRNCPVCINGTGTDDEVSVNRNLPRVETNRLRGGSQLVMSDGLCLKAPKLKKYAAMLGLDWSWLDRFIKVKDTGTKKEILPVKKYIEGAAAGRPIFAYPSRFGGFRLRLGRTRSTGLMAKAIHPVTMYLLEEFPAVGSQLKVERPGKATTINSCDVIEPPIVLTKQKEIIKLENMEMLRKYKDEVSKILFLGDMLVNLGDFRKSGHPLVPVGFCEEWWHKIVLKKSEENPELKTLIKNMDYKNVDPYLAVKLSVDYEIPLYPKYIYFYKQMCERRYSLC
jgi:DNA polymerase II large subunit